MKTDQLTLVKKKQIQGIGIWWNGLLQQNKCTLLPSQLYVIPLEATPWWKYYPTRLKRLIFLSRACKLLQSPSEAKSLFGWKSRKESLCSLMYWKTVKIETCNKSFYKEVAFSCFEENSSLNVAEPFFSDY